MATNDDTSLLINTQTSTTQPAKWFNTEEYWTVWIAAIWFSVTVGLTYWGATIARIYTWAAADIVISFSRSNVGGLCLLINATLATLYIAHLCLRHDHAPLWQYIVICILVIICMIIGNFSPLARIGMGTPVWCILTGIIMRNSLRDRWSPKYMFSLDFFIKISICLLAINIKQAAAVGARGLLVAWAETIILIGGTYFIGVKVLAMKNTEAILTTCTIGICGGSAAMAIGGALCIEKEIIGAAITIMSIFTIPLIPALPLVAPQLILHANFNNETIGAWIGGSVDTTGAVLASAVLAGPYILQPAIVIKMLQNILIGPVVLVVTAIWHKTFSPVILWDKFPKFVIGFIVVSVVTTFLPDDIGAQVATNSFTLSEWFSSISFILIGADIDIFALMDRFTKYKWMLALYLIGQTVDIGSTLAAAYLAFMTIPAAG